MGRGEAVAGAALAVGAAELLGTGDAADDVGTGLGGGTFDVQATASPTSSASSAALIDLTVRIVHDPVAIRLQ